MTGEGKKVLVVLGKIAPGTKGKIRVGLKFLDLPILIIAFGNKSSGNVVSHQERFPVNGDCMFFHASATFRLLCM